MSVWLCVFFVFPLQVCLIYVFLCVSSTGLFDYVSFVFPLHVCLIMYVCVSNTGLFDYVSFMFTLQVLLIMYLFLLHVYLIICSLSFLYRSVWSCISYVSSTGICLRWLCDSDILWTFCSVSAGSWSEAHWHECSASNAEAISTRWWCSDIFVEPSTFVNLRSSASPRL